MEKQVEKELEQEKEKLEIQKEEKTNKKKKNKEKNKAKTIANASLVGMGAGFIATSIYDGGTGLKLLQGGFEAGLVGGLADWFAVTALFRHPLNIKIPHTALLPKNREKITQAMLKAVEQELLNKESLLKKMENIHFTDMALDKFEEYTKEKEFESIINELKKNAIEYIEKTELNTLKTELKKILQTKEKEIKTEDVLTKVVDKIIEESFDEKATEMIIQIIDKKINEPNVKTKINQFVIDTIQKKAENGLFKLALMPILSLGKEKIETMLTNAIDESMQELKNENSSSRFAIKKTIKLEINKLKENEELIQTIENKRGELLSDSLYDGIINKIIEQAKTQLKNKMQEDEFTPFIVNIVQKGITKVRENKAMKEKIENKIKDVIGKTIENNHEKIGHLIKENMDKMTNEQLTEMLEDKIGKEIAWIRVNGSLCGFAIGVVLTAIHMII